MDSSGFRRVREAFEAALALPAEARVDAVRSALRDDPDLAREAERMLAAHATDERFLEPPSAETLVDLAHRHETHVVLQPGAHIGGFELVRPIGAGGMGEVWEARQESPARSVALKALRSGLGTERSRRRFEEESQVLARLSHPGIAKVLASGVLEGPEGGPPRPWFAMELIEGARPLTAFARELPLRRRLLLLREACVAVQHGHLRGVIHRDLKPDNCLVDLEGRVRVIDFGIARATGETDLSLTAGGELLGTLGYMSPEQVLGLSEGIDVRTDVHALGVLLYHLLTGRSPWISDSSSWTALAKEVCERDPEPPSRLVPSLSRELDWVTARAMAKEPDRRYASAQDLADELGRYLDHQPLHAGPPSATYAARKFVRRNRAWVVGGAVAATLLLLGSAGTGWGLYKSVERGRELEARGIELETERASAVAARADAEAARAQAEERLERAEMLNRFLNTMLRGANPLGVTTTTSSESTVGEMLDRAASEVMRAFPGQSVLEADTRLLIGLSYYGQGRYESAQEHIEGARQIFADLLPERAFEWVRASRLLATLRGRRGDHAAAAQDLLELRGLAHGYLDDTYPELAAIDSDLAWALQESGQLTESIPYAQAARDRFVEFGPEFSPMAATAASHLARATRVLGDDEATEAAYRSARELIVGAYGPLSVQAGVAASNLGTFLFGKGRNAEARELFEEAIAILQIELDGDHPTVATLLYNLGGAVYELGELEESERISIACLEMNERLWGPDHSETLDAVASLGLVQIELGQFDEASVNFERAAVGRSAQLGPDHRRTVYARARALEARGLADPGSAAAVDAAVELDELYQHCLEVSGPAASSTQTVAAAGLRLASGTARGNRDLWAERVIE
ncbi:serine/threonine-protein kinase [Engelhardtia mirabilis]|uniref:Serine/threonine-protein kinase PknB n=1 Tax=Engelhardtia mirabilis TaxID=2528011 RepID=A0A518BEK8_9BACT|nr:Serine/threonine-protein kinase PknB [Planctomycetes bacterium Pla133]QDU99708.1 Serine/threonine-protein kinase PknB [Planctomycetes bacterium Pla86]